MTKSFYRESSTLEEQKQPLTKNIVHAPTNTTPAESVLPPTANPQVSLASSLAQPAAYNQCTMVAASNCAGCVQFQQQCQQQSHEAMEMTAILHSQPPLQLVSCHGPIMHPSTPSNQR